MARYYVWVTSQACAQNKLFLSILNTTADQIVKLESLYLVNSKLSSVTGVGIEFDALKITAITGGTAVTPVPADSGDGTAASFTCVHTATSVTGSTIFFSHFTSDDEVGVTGAFPTQMIERFGNLLPTPLILKKNIGLALKQITASTAGSFGVLAIVNILQV